MRESLISAIISVCISAGGGEPPAECWDVDRPVVVRGGCVTLIVRSTCGPMDSLSLQIDDRDVIRLLALGPILPSHFGHLSDRSTALILLFQDLMNPEGIENTPGASKGSRLVPIFNEQGMVHLTLYSIGRSLGTKSINVAPASPEAAEALEVLFPTLVSGQRASKHDVLWGRLVSEQSFGVVPSLTADELAFLHQHLATVTQHPDWKEVCEIRLASLEAQSYVREVDEAINDAREAGDVLEALPRLPDFVQQTINSHPKGAFANELRSQVAGRLRGYEALFRRQRGVPRSDGP